MLYIVLSRGYCSIPERDANCDKKNRSVFSSSLSLSIASALPAASILFTIIITSSLCRLWVHGLLEVDTELFPDAIEFLNVLVVLALVLHLCLDSCDAVLVQTCHNFFAV